MIYTLPEYVVFAGHIMVLVMSFYLGAKINKHFLHFEVGRGSNLVVEGTLLSLLLGFTFGNASEKSSDRKKIFSDEINAISSVHSITRFYPDSQRLVLQKELIAYCEKREQYYEAGTSLQRINASLSAADSISDILVSRVAEYSKEPQSLVYSQQMIPSLNELFDLATTRELSRTTRVPIAALKFLLMLSVLVSFMHGINSELKKSDWFSAIGFAVLISMTIYLILDLDSSRKGFITLEDQQELLRNLITKMISFR